MNDLGNSFANFFGVAVRGQTYLNALYLLMSFPLGIFYFVFLVTGLALGFPLIIIWIGLLILAAVFAVWYGLLAFERHLAIWMLKEDIPPMQRQDLAHLNLWQKFVAAVSNPVTWKGLVYLFAKFPLGIFSFVILITLLAISAGLIAAPFYYQYIQPQVDLSLTGTGLNPIWIVETPIEAAITCLAGIVLALVSMHIFNGLAWVSGKFARVMLGNFSADPNRPAPVAPPHWKNLRSKSFFEDRTGQMASSILENPLWLCQPKIEMSPFWLCQPKVEMSPEFPSRDVPF